MSFSGLKWLRVPKPSQTGHAPNGLLNENKRGSSSATARSHSGHECFAEKRDLGVRHSSTIKLQYHHLNAVQFQMIQQYGCLSHHVL